MALIAAIGFGLGCSVAPPVTPASSEVPDLIRARRLEIVDDDDGESVAITPGSIYIKSPVGMTSVVGGVVLLKNEYGTDVVNIGGSQSGGVIEVRSSKSELTMAEVAQRLDDTALTETQQLELMKKTSGQMAVSITVGNAGGGNVSIFNPPGKPVATLRSSAANYGVLIVADRDGKKKSFAP